MKTKLLLLLAALLIMPEIGFAQAFPSKLKTAGYLNVSGTGTVAGAFTAPVIDTSGNTFDINDSGDNTFLNSTGQFVGNTNVVTIGDVHGIANGIKATLSQNGDSITLNASSLVQEDGIPVFKQSDTSVSAKDLIITTDGNKTFLQEAADTNGDILTLDLTNSRVGVGTAAPTVALDVVGSIKVTENSDTGGGTGLYLSNDGSESISMASFNTAPSTSLNFFNANGTFASPSAIVNNNLLGQIIFKGYDTASSNSADILCKASAAHGSSGDSTDAPGKLEFYTVPDGSGTLTKRLTIADDGELITGSGTPAGFSTNHITDQSGAKLTAGGTWTNFSSRFSKKNIINVTGASAWNTLDSLQVVDFEYRKQLTKYTLQGGAVVDATGLQSALSGKVFTEIDGATRPLEDQDIVLDSFVIRTNEGSGEFHRGFIADDMPDNLKQVDGISALDIAANNTLILQEMKRVLKRQNRIIRKLTRRVKALEALH